MAKKNGDPLVRKLRGILSAEEIKKVSKPSKKGSRKPTLYTTTDDGRVVQLNLDSLMATSPKPRKSAKMRAKKAPAKRSKAAPARAPMTRAPLLLPPSTTRGGEITLVRSADGSYGAPSGAIVLASRGSAALGRPIPKVKTIYIDPKPVKSKKTKAKPTKAKGKTTKPKSTKPKSTKPKTVKSKPTKKRTLKTASLAVAKTPKKRPKPTRKRRKSGSTAKRKKSMICFPAGSGVATKMAARRSKPARPKKRRAARKPAPARRKKATRKKASRSPSALPFGLSGAIAGVPPHRPGRVTSSCVKCGRVHTLSEHWSHRVLHGRRKVEASYKCRRGGVCEFQAVEAGGPRSKVLKTSRTSEKLALNPRGLKKQMDFILLQEKLEAMARRRR